MANAAEEDVLDSLEVGRDAGLLTDEDGECRFVHDLVRETIEMDLSAGRCRFWHRRIGHALARLPAHRSERRAADIAWHLREGDDLEQALMWTMRSADAAAAVFGHADAEWHCRSADELAEALGDDEPRGSVAARAADL